MPNMVQDIKNELGEEYPLTAFKFNAAELQRGCNLTFKRGQTMGELGNVG